MKSRLSLCLLFFQSMISYAQMSPDSMSHTIQTLYNKQEAGMLYDLTNASFQSKISKAAFENVLKSQLFPYGNITKMEALGAQGTVYRYKCLLEKTAVLQMAMGMDDQGKLHTLMFQPWKEPTAVKRDILWHDNALATPTDSLVHQYAERYLKENSHTPGVAIGYLKGTKALSYNYGIARPSTSQHPTAQTIYEIGSITKTFTAFLLADAVVSKKARLEDAITQYLPDSVAANKYLQGISLLQLANHTSGLPRMPDNYMEGSVNTSDPYAVYDENLLFKYLKRVKPATEAGKTYDYSNTGYGLLGVILEKIYNQPLEVLYNEKIFKPLKMANSFATAVTDTSMTALPVDAKGAPTNYWNFKAMAGAGAIKSTSIDLLRYSLAFTLKPRTKGKIDERIMLMEKITHSADPVFLSLGWHFSKAEASDRLMEHNGGTGGFSSYLGIIPDRQMAVVVLADCAEQPGASLLGKRLTEGLKALK